MDNVSYPFGDGQPPANLPVVNDPPAPISGLVQLDTCELLMGQLDISLSLESTDDGGYRLLLSEEWK